MSADVKRLPCAIESEKIIIGSLLLDSRSYINIADVVVASDFYLNSNRIIFEQILKYIGKDQPFDAITVVEQLEKLGKLDEVGGERMIIDLANNCPTAVNLIAHANTVKSMAIHRGLIKVGQNIASLGFTPEDKEVDELLEQAEQSVFALSDNRAKDSGPESLNDILAATTTKIDRLYESGDAVTGVETGFKDLDSFTSGLQAGDLIIAAGRPSMGKTVFGINIAEHVAISSEKSVLVFSLEMPSDAIVMRMLSSLGRINQQRLRTGKLSDDDWPRLTSAVSILSDAKMFIDDTPALSPTDMRARARRVAQKEGGLSLIVVDYLQLMQIPGNKENRTSEISEISRSLKALAKELNVPVIALSQLNRSLEQRQDKRPVMSDLRESGAIEQDADVIAFIYRDEVYNEDSTNKGVAEIIIGKQRNGPIGKVLLTFLGEFTKFEDYAKPQWSE